MQYDPTEKRQLQSILKEHGLAPNKQLGQNFLIDKNKRKEIIQSAGNLSDKTVLEIGPGAGALTVKLVELAKQTVAIELDAGLYQLLLQQFQDTDITLLHQDALKVDYDALLPQKDSVAIANLPYYVTTPILFQLLESKRIGTMVLTMQKEVADRLNAKPSTKDYSQLSIAVQYHAEVKTVTNLPPGCFYPQPKVHSAAVLLSKRKFHLSPNDEAFFLKLVRTGFSMRRKTLANNLSHQLGIPKEKAAAALSACNLSESIRAEALSIEEFIALSNVLFSQI